MITTTSNCLLYFTITIGIMLASAQEKTFTFDEKLKGSECAGTPSCPNTTYHCNNQTNSNFNIDISVQGMNVVTNVDITIWGKFECGGKGPVSFFLNGQLFTVQDPIDSHCSCDICDTKISYNSPVTNGLAAYDHQGPNTLSISSNHTICISRVFVLIHAIDMSSLHSGVVLPLCGPLSGGTKLSIWMTNWPNQTGDIYFQCLWMDSVNKRQYTSEMSYIQDGFSCNTPPVINAETMQFGFYVPSVRYAIPLIDEGGYPVTWTFYKMPTLEKIVKGNCNDMKVILIGQNFLNGSCRSQRCKWVWPKHDDIKTGTWMGGDTFECERPSNAPNGSVISISLDTEAYSPQSAIFICDDTPALPDGKKPLPGWIIVLFIFGGATALAVAILAISQRALARKRDGEKQGLMSGTHSINNSAFLYRSINFDTIKCQQKIGKGTFGEVFRGIWNGTEVAVKFLNMSNMNAEFLDDFHKEVNIMRGLRHPNILQFLGACTSMPNVCIVMEYMPFGSLYRILHDDSTKDASDRLSNELVKRMMLDAARGMNYLHKSHPIIIHRDLKSHNLLVDENWKVKVCDFGLSKIMETQSEFSLMTACGTPSWSAPEILRSERYTEKVDIYSFGIVLWECITREDPYMGMAPYQVVIAVGTKSMRPVIPPGCPPTWSTLMRECWQEDAEGRPSFDEIMNKIGEL